MTANQLTWLGQQETQRANLAKEEENRRTNVAKEQEAMRANKAQEQLKTEAQAEQQRHNLVAEEAENVKAASSFINSINPLGFLKGLL